MKHIKTLLLVALAFAFVPAYAQDEPADNMEVLKDMVQADKKLVIADSMDLTQSEADAFWPVYDEYQDKLAEINKRYGDVIKAYAEGYNAMSLDDESALALMKTTMKIEKDESKLKQKYYKKLKKVLPGMKVVRYLQIENKLRAIIKYELAMGIPLNE